MTVGQELTKITDLRLFHNHMTIEPTLEIFGEFNATVIKKLRDVIFEEFAKSNKYGLIFTFILAFDCKEDWENTAEIVSIFEKYSSEVYYVELVASQEVRLNRNKTENRLLNKPSKRNIEFSNKLLLHDDEHHRMISYDDEIPFENYIKIDNTDISAKETAKIIKDKFNL